MLPLGKKPATQDRRDLLFERLVDLTALPTPPARFGHGNLFHGEWQMLGNDQYGDCVFAGAAHETMLLNRIAGRTVAFNDASVLGDYSAVTGFTPTDPSSDQGTDVREALRYRQATGLADLHGQRHRIGAYVALHAGDYDMLMQAVYLFAVVGIGINFPASAMQQFQDGQPWTVVPGSPSEGGHYVPVCGRTGPSEATVITWGKRQQMSRGFYTAMCDEAYAFVSEEELRHGQTERGFDLAGLNAALQQLR